VEPPSGTYYIRSKVVAMMRFKGRMTFVEKMRKERSVDFMAVSQFVSPYMSLSTSLFSRRRT